jgi:protein-tyrosine-phosphatase
MSAKQRGTVGVIDPHALKHSFLLADFCDGVEGDIPDPIGKDIESYEETFELIKECLIRMRDLLLNFEGWKK